MAAGAPISICWHQTMDTLTPIVALVGGLYDMVPWREVLIGVGIVVWLWAGLQKSYGTGAEF